MRKYIWMHTRTMELIIAHGDVLLDMEGVWSGHFEDEWSSPSTSVTLVGLHSDQWEMIGEL